MYVSNANEFVFKATELFQGNDPSKTRLTLSYEGSSDNSPAILVCKVTDDVTCLKFKATEQKSISHVFALVDLFSGVASSE